MDRKKERSDLILRSVCIVDDLGLNKLQDPCILNISWRGKKILEIFFYSSAIGELLNSAGCAYKKRE